MSPKYAALGALHQALAPARLSSPPPPQSTSKQPIPKPNSTYKQTKLDPHFQIPAPPTQPTIPSSNTSTLDSPDLVDSPPEDTPIQYQHRFNSSYPNDQSWLGIRIAPKPKNVVRLWSHNINGIKSKHNFIAFAEILEALTQYELDFLGITETNLNSSNHHVRDSMDAITRCVLPASRHILSSTIGHPSQDSFQHGGTFSISYGQLSSRVASMGCDKYGRFTWTQYFGKKHHLRIYNVYRPCVQNDNSEGDQTVWQQHRRALRHDNIQLDPRKQILNSLALHIKEDIAKKRQVIVMGDFNEDIFDPTLNSIFSDIGLYNIIEQYIDKSISARSYFRGSKLIDGMWCTKNVLDAIRSFGIAPFYFVIPSDHRAIFCDLDFHHILDDHPHTIQPAPYRRLISTAPKRVEAYKSSVEKQWFLHNITLKVDQLEDLFSSTGCNDRTITLLNKIDAQINEILTTGEKRCCKVGRQDNNQYSNELGKSIRNERYLRCALGRESMSQSFQFQSKKISKLLVDLRNTHRDKRNAKAHEVDFRNKHLDDRAEQYVRDHPGTNKNNVITQLKNIERQIRESTRIDYALNGRKSGIILPAYSFKVSISPLHVQRS